MKQPPVRSAHFSFRAAPATVFASDVAGDIRGQSMSTFIERAVIAEADKVQHNGKTWRDFWDDSEAVRELKRFAEPGFLLNGARSRTREFIMAHAVFFYDRTKHGLEVNRQRAEVLWPLLEHWVDLYEQSKTVSPWATGDKMATELKKTKPPIKPPEWGPGK